MKGASVVQCHKAIDVVLLIDGSGSLGQEGWDAEIKAAKQFLDAFMDQGSHQGDHAQVATILYSGPSTWAGVGECTGKNSGDVDQENLCKIKVVNHFTSDLASVRSKVNLLAWPKGSTLTSVALLTAQAELALGRKNAHSTVVVFQDGQPLSFRKTRMASHVLRKKSRLLFVVISKFSPLKAIKEWVTRRWQENLVDVKSTKEFGSPNTVTKIIADICPSKIPKLKMDDQVLELAQTKAK